MNCVRTGTKEGAACDRCQKRKKKCELPTNNKNPQKNKIRNTAPLPKRALKSPTATAASSFGVTRQPQTAPLELFPARSDISGIIVVNPLPRAPTPPALPRSVKRRREEMVDRKAPATHSRSENLNRTGSTHLQNQAYVELPAARVPGGVSQPELLERLLTIEQMQETTLESVQRLEKLLDSWMASTN
jgi:hypothetical protein